jgi:hypothetical protein
VEYARIHKRFGDKESSMPEPGLHIKVGAEIIYQIARLLGFAKK